MRRITLWFIGTVAAVVLLFTYRTSTSGPTSVAAGNSAYAPGVVNGSSSGAGSDTSSNSTSTGSSTSGGSTSASGATVVNGTVAQTQWGPVQVQVKVSDAKIVDVVVLQQPNGNRHDEEINSYALPMLRQQVLQAQSAQIDGVSGATVTSDGYRESLQSALALVHIGG
jgi:uncharacterized protein with FMN-binding domain